MSALFLIEIGCGAYSLAAEVAPTTRMQGSLHVGSRSASPEQLRAFAHDMQTHHHALSIGRGFGGNVRGYGIIGAMGRALVRLNEGGKSETNLHFKTRADKTIVLYNPDVENVRQWHFFPERPDHIPTIVHELTHPHRITKEVKLLKRQDQVFGIGFEIGPSYNMVELLRQLGFLADALSEYV